MARRNRPPMEDDNDAEDKENIGAQGALHDELTNNDISQFKA